MNTRQVRLRPVKSTIPWLYRTVQQHSLPPPPAWYNKQPTKGRNDRATSAERALTGIPGNCKLKPHRNRKADIFAAHCMPPTWRENQEISRFQGHTEGLFWDFIPERAVSLSRCHYGNRKYIYLRGIAHKWFNGICGRMVGPIVHGSLRRPVWIHKRFNLGWGKPDSLATDNLRFSETTVRYDFRTRSSNYLTITIEERILSVMSARTVDTHAMLTV